MNLDGLAFLSWPAFVLAWYVFGAATSAWMAWDLTKVNNALKPAIKWAWPIVGFFFSVIGLALYVFTARAPGVGRTDDADEKQRLHAQYQESMVRRVNGAVIHCVAGDGLGIMTAMVIARLLELTFWQEFWFEYAVGFAFGWLIFQLKSMRMMADGIGQALWMAFRAEFFSMLTVMGGMGAVMTYVTPMVVGMQPKPDTAAFWGFGTLGLLVGYVFTFPMNWMLIKIGWKHGMGPKEGARTTEGTAARWGLGAAMVALGALAMAIPAWLSVQRLSVEAQLMAASMPDGPLGLGRAISTAREHLQSHERGSSVAVLDGAMRLAEVARSLQVEHAQEAGEAVRSAREHLQNGSFERAAQALDLAAAPGAIPTSATARPSRYRGVELIDARGVVIGEIREAEAGRVVLALGRGHDLFGFWDPPPDSRIAVGVGELAWGPVRTVGKSFAMLPAQAPQASASGQVSAAQPR